MSYRLKYHVYPEHGWINDPFLFSYFLLYYLFFYKYYPDDPVWVPLLWGLVRIKFLVHWVNLPIALTPGDKEDLHGCFSGSAVEYNNR